MFHLPHIPFVEIHEFLIEIAVTVATGISVYEFLHSKLRRNKRDGKRKNE
jgi:hypothetical protein